MDQAVQIFGALLILVAFAGAQARRMETDSRLYLLLNLWGSALLTVLAAIEGQLGFLLLEGVWVLVSIWGLNRVLRGTPSSRIG
jgi:hypothetical protein